MPELNLFFQLGIKIIILVGFGVYAVFALMVVKQVNLMTEVVSIGLSSLFKLFAWIHLAFSVFLVIVALVLL